MTPVAVWEQVYPHQPMVETCPDLIGLIGAVFDPETHIVEQVSQFHRNPVGINADILAGPPIVPGPFPDPAKHSLVQVVQELLRENIAFAIERPFFAVNDVGLFGFVELGAQRDIGGDEPLLFFG